MMRTEDDLRAAFQALESYTPDAGRVLHAVRDYSPDPAPGSRPAGVRPRSARLRPVRLTVTVGVAAVVAAAVVAAAALAGGRAGGPGSPGPPRSVSARLLAAISSARGDILHAGGLWVAPWYPRAGQQVRVHELGVAADGMPVKDNEYIFRFPDSRAAGHDINPIDWGALSVTGTLITIDHARHTWGEWPHSSIYLALPLSAAGIRAQISSGLLHVIGPATLHGHPAIELALAPGPQDGPLQVTTARLWVSAATYLPMRELLKFSDGKQDLTNYTFLKPTPANLAKVSPVIPASYHRTSLHPDQYGKKYSPAEMIVRTT
jgi:hypothetical protein